MSEDFKDSILTDKIIDELARNYLVELKYSYEWAILENDINEFAWEVEKYIRKKLEKS